MFSEHSWKLRGAAPTFFWRAKEWPAFLDAFSRKEYNEFVTNYSISISFRRKLCSCLARDRGEWVEERESGKKPNGGETYVRKRELFHF
ncbi:hypothetical protein BSNK01_25560 [Bacillaceae bacterium]